MRHGDLDAALRDADLAYQSYSKVGSDWAWRFLIQKAHILVLRGSFKDALELIAQEPPISIVRSDAGVERKLVQGLAHIYLEEFADAEKALADADQIAASFQSSLSGDVALARGILEVSRNRNEEAAVAYHAALHFARERNLPFLEASTLGNLGHLAVKQEHFDEANDWFRATLQKAESVGATSTVAPTYGNMAWNYSMIGDFENAELFYKQALEKSGNAGLVGNRVYWLNTLGEVLYLQRRYDEAQITSEKALSLARGGDDRSTLTACLDTLSEIALATGHVDIAAAHNEEALEVEKPNPDQYAVRHSQLLAGRIAAGRRLFPQAEATFISLIGDPKAETDLKWEAHARLAEVFAAEKQPVKAENEFRRAIETVQNAQRSLQSEDFRVSFLSSAIEFYDAYVDFFIGQKRPLDALKVADLSRAQTLEEGWSSSAAKERAKSAFNPQSVARRLNSTLLFYWLGEGRSYLWVITSTKTAMIALPASAAIDSSVKSYRQSFLEPRDPLEAGNSDGKKLYLALVAPAEKLIPKDSRVVILPDGSLNSLNFETLIVSQPRPHYWIEDVTITTANSLAVLSRSSPAMPPKNDRLLMVGDALPASSDFPPLPQAGKEIGLLENYFASSHRLELTGANATATRFLSSQPEKFAYLHFATHGTASRLRPLESAVILSPEGESYKLYARDVLKHPLTAYLVTISACNGAGTKSYAGEGLVGLSWAFLRAGAHNVIAGLWEVSNASTPQLMDELYKGVHAGQDPATALRNAKLILLHSDGNYRRPFYWAPFLLYSGS
jgi:CHAT domain-containing protein/Tfp pilus assembly protein PilF